MGLRSSQQIFDVYITMTTGIIIIIIAIVDFSIFVMLMTFLGNEPWPWCWGCWRGLDMGYHDHYMGALCVCFPLRPESLVLQEMSTHFLCRLNCGMFNDGYVRDGVSNFVSDWVIKYVIGWVEWVSEWEDGSFCVGVLLTQWVSKCVNEWVGWWLSKINVLRGSEERLEREWMNPRISAWVVDFWLSACWVNGWMGK